MEEGQAIESRAVSHRIEEAQKKVEQRDCQIRKNLLEYYEVLAEQRRRVYGYRQAILDGADCKLLIREMIPLNPEELGQQLSAALDRAFRPEILKTQRARLLALLDKAWKEHLLTMDRLRSSVGQQEHAKHDPRLYYKREAERAFEKMWTSLKQRVVELIFGG